MATILIVDDEENVRTLLIIALEVDYNIIAAGNGQEGLRLFKEHNPDLVITDINMPIMSGVEMVRLMRGLSPDIKIIAHSSFIRPYEEPEMLKAGADICLKKPVSLQTIEEAVKTLLTKTEHKKVRCKTCDGE
jgi:YesN/AraC family two-component response regulator